MNGTTIITTTSGRVALKLSRRNRIVLQRTILVDNMKWRNFLSCIRVLVNSVVAEICNPSCDAQIRRRAAPEVF